MMSHAAQVAFVCALLGQGSVNADVLRLRNGGEIRGSIQSNDEQDFTARTATGSTLGLSADEVHFFVRRSDIEEQFETRLRQAENTADAHWQLAEWCRLNKLKPQRIWQAQRVLLCDPNHVEARRLLGYIHTEEGWTTRERQGWQRGYVKSGSRFVPRQTRDTIARTPREKESQATWLSRMGRLANAIDAADEAALAELASVRDPMALAGLTAYFRESNSVAARKAYVTALAKTKHPAMIPPLVEQAVFDVSPDVRQMAARLIPHDQRKTATRLLAEYLRSNKNQTVQQAAAALGVVAHEDSIDPLIESLITLHEYTTRASAAKEAQLRAANLLNKPNLTPGEVLIVLQTGIVPSPGVESTTEESNGQIQALYPHRNEAALAALKELTDEDFGFDQRTWRLWFRSEKRK